MGCFGKGMRVLVLVALLAGCGAPDACPERCACYGARVACSRVGLRAPPPLPLDTVALDLSSNNVSWATLGELGTLRSLRDLNLSRNPLGADTPWPGGAPALHRLWLEGCALLDPPARALAPLAQLHLLSLAENALTELPEAAFPPLPELHTLILRRNRIWSLHERAFEHIPALRVLRLEDNRLTTLPSAVRLLPALEDLSVAYNAINSAGPLALSGPKDGATGPPATPGAPLDGGGKLTRLDARGNPLGELHAASLDRLPALAVLLLSEARSLRSLPWLNGSRALRVLRADRARLATLPPGLCARAPQLRVLDLKLNHFERLPDLSECSELRVLDLSSNRISSLIPDEEAEEELLETEGPAPGSPDALGYPEPPGYPRSSGYPGGSLRGLRRLTDLLLARNLLRRVPRTAFVYTPRLLLLNLEGNQIDHIDTEAFVPISRLEDLNVGENDLSSLPGSGLARLRHLKAHNNPRLRRVPPPSELPRATTLVLSYAYHCCEWLEGDGEDKDESSDEEGGLSDLVLIPGGRVDAAAWANASQVWPAYLNASLRLAAAGRRRVQCAPAPGPFLPCEDLFDWWTLRCGVWAVFLLALLGNGTVVFVLLWSRARLDVPRFLVTNLAGADLCMGCYLGLLAVVDAGTLGEFRAHAVAWQLSAACRLAGFLAVLSTELSVFTLAVITLERNYAITHAMHLNKRLSLRHAMAVMAVGWALALAAAALPLAGISDYRTFAVCLPFETRSPAALGYVLALLTANGVAFLVLLGCYLKMYCAIRGSQAWNTNDSRIAKRMALLVFTDFLCWAPVALCALCAALGAPLVGLEQAKVLTVFVLPLNSCCNPFLYAILTKQFKKDCALVCKAIEESRVTRGIGRCRHSSNFSNRQTPANTNSLAERSSRGGGVPCACRPLLTAPPARGERLLRWLRAAGGAPTPQPILVPPTRPPARAGSVSSSVEFSSSRSDSWRAYGRPPPPRRAASWLVARKTSQDSNLSSSRNDSSGSNATASTGTWRTSRSACSAGPGARPRLTRQPAVCGDEPPPSPAPHAPRLRTIPSEADGVNEPPPADHR